MGMLIIRHKVQDYGKWRPAFDRHAGAQKSAGLTNPRVFRSSDDKNEVVILFDTDDTKKAKDFASSPDLKETMAKAGVMDSPAFYFLESAEPLRTVPMDSYLGVQCCIACSSQSSSHVASLNHRISG